MSCPVPAPLHAVRDGDGTGLPIDGRPLQTQHLTPLHPIGQSDHHRQFQAMTFRRPHQDPRRGICGSHAMRRDPENRQSQRQRNMPVIFTCPAAFAG